MSIKISKIKKQVQKKESLQVIIPNWETLDHCLTQSLINCFRKCPRKFLYSVNRFTNKEGTIRALFGNIAHYILGRYYKLKTVYKGSMLEQFILEYEGENQDTLQEADEQEVEIIKAMVIIVMTEYFKYYKTDSQKKFIDTEKEMIVPFNGINLLMKIDGKFNTKDKKHFLLETKTKSRISEDSMMKVLSFDSQNLTYIIGAENYYNHSIDGVLYNIIRKPQIKPHKGEMLKDFSNRLQKDIQDRPEFYFIRYEIPYTKIDKELFKKELKEVIDRIDFTIRKAGEKSQDESVYYKNSISCEFPFPCDFLSLCSSKKTSGYTRKERLFSELNEVTGI